MNKVNVFFYSIELILVASCSFRCALSIYYCIGNAFICIARKRTKVRLGPTRRTKGKQSRDLINYIDNRQRDNSTNGIGVRLTILAGVDRPAQFTINGLGQDSDENNRS